MVATFWILLVLFVFLGLSILALKWRETLIAAKRSKFFGLHPVLNYLYYNPQTVVMDYSKYDYVVKDGFKYRFDKNVDQIIDIVHNPWYAGIRPTDIVLDIGAHIGGVTIPLASKAKRVIALEPLFHDELRTNVELNSFKNVQIIPIGLGSNGNRLLEYGGRKISCRFTSATDFWKILRTTETDIDFLQSNCEGGEWEIAPDLCKGIRELRFMFHIRYENSKEDYAKFQNWLKWFEDNKYTVEYHRFGAKIDFYFARMYLLKASKGS